jgi:hypothetical protein
VLRLTLCFALLFTAMGLWRSASAIAFTLRLVPIPATASPSDFPIGGLADLPTPQFFRFVIASDGMTLALEPRRAAPAVETLLLRQTQIVGNRQRD